MDISLSSPDKKVKVTVTMQIEKLPLKEMLNIEKYVRDLRDRAEKVVRKLEGEKR